jgi:hypothetical protein
VELMDNWHACSSSAVDSLSDALELNSKHGALGCSTVVDGPECVSRFTPFGPWKQVQKECISCSEVAAAVWLDEVEDRTVTSVDVD